MPKTLKKSLKKSANKACGKNKECQNAYVYGTMNKIEKGTTASLKIKKKK